MGNKGRKKLSDFSYPSKYSVGFCASHGIHKLSEKERKMKSRKQLGWWYKIIVFWQIWRWLPTHTERSCNPGWLGNKNCRWNSVAIMQINAQRGKTVLFR